MFNLQKKALAKSLVTDFGSLACNTGEGPVFTNSNFPCNIHIIKKSDTFMKMHRLQNCRFVHFKADICTRS